MNKKYNHFAVILLLIIISLVSCKNIQKNDSTEELTETISNQTNTELVLNIKKEDISDIENEKIYQDIKYSTIELQNANNNALSKSLDELNNNIKEEAENFKTENYQNIRDLIIEMSNDDAMYEYDVSLRVTHKGNKYLSIVDNTYVYLMGAHGSTILRGYTYDISNGWELSLFDFINDREELRAYIKNWLKQQEENVFFDEAYETIDNYIDENSELEFYINDNELYVVFQQYDIAPYAYGIIEVKIDKDLLKLDITL